MPASDLSSQPSKKHVRVGVGVIVKDPQDPGKFFAGIRKGSHGAGSLALPGGHLEWMESWEECAKREVQEEMGISITHLKLGHVTNDIMESEDKHYVTIFMMGDCTLHEKRPKNMEPNKCEGWESFTWEELKAIQVKGSPKLFGPLQGLVCANPPAIIAFVSREGV